MKVLITNGTIIDPVNSIKDKMDVLLENNLIKSISKNINDNIDYVIDAKDLYVTPGFVDLHPNFCDPGATDREDLKSGSFSAAKGGITHVVLGVDNKPAPSECNVIDYIIRYASIMPTNIYTSAAITEDRAGEEVSDINFLYSHGAFAFYDGLRAVSDKNILAKAMQLVKSKNRVISIFSGTTDDKCVRGILEGSISKKLKIKNATPVDAESEDLKLNLKLAKMYDVKIDLAYVTEPASFDIVDEAKKDNPNVFAETPAINLILNEKAIEKKESLAKVIPPLRPEADRTALLKALKKGTIDIISSNHVPIEEKEKNLKFKDASSGAIGLETMLGICGMALVEKGILTWKEVIEKISVNPAKLYGLDRDGVGSLKEGTKANITIFDPNEKWNFDEESIVSKSHNSPLIGCELLGKVKYTICNGKLVYHDTGLNKNEKE